MHTMSLIFDLPLHPDDLQHEDIVAIECKLVKDKSDTRVDRAEFLVQRVVRLAKAVERRTGRDQ